MAQTGVELGMKHGSHQMQILLTDQPILAGQQGKVHHLF